MKGFTIGDLLISLVILAVLIALLTPFYIKAKEKATQISTMADMHAWGEAIATYISDHLVAPTNPWGEMNYKKAIIRELSPYLRAIRIVDWWGHPFQIWTGKGVKQYGINTNNETDFLVVSLGRKSFLDGWTYDPKNPESGFFEIKEIEDFNNDLVIWNNKFIRCPQKK